LKSSITFPWWFIFITYGLCLILVGISIFFIIVRGIEFGDLKTQKWLTSSLSGFFSSILLTQPMKILCLAIFFAFFCRKVNDDKEANEHLDDNQLNLDNDEEYLHLTKGLFSFYIKLYKINSFYRINLYLFIDQQFEQIV
jgi:polycystin 1L2